MLLMAITSLRRSGLHGELNPSWAKCFQSAPHAQSLIFRHQYDVLMSTSDDTTILSTNLILQCYLHDREPEATRKVQTTEKKKLTDRR